MSLANAIGQIDRIVQWEQQLAAPVTASQTTATGGVAISNNTSAAPQGGSLGAAPVGTVSASGGAFAAALAQAQSTGTSLASPASSAGSLPAASSAPVVTAASDPRVQAMLQEANTLVGKPYVWGGGHNGWGPQTGYDCSGFVSAVLHAGGYLTTPQDTMTLAQASGIEPGPGRFVTIYNRDAPGQTGHVIIDLGGQFYESGGQQGGWGGGGGVAAIQTPSPAYLASFNQVLHPAGL